MVYGELYGLFKSLFPDDAGVLRGLEEESGAEASDGMHVMFGMVAVPFIIRLLENRDEDKLKRAFAFFEEMARSGDGKVSEVLEFTVLEDIISRGKDVREAFMPYMGSETVKSFTAVERFLM